MFVRSRVLSFLIGNSTCCFKVLSVIRYKYVCLVNECLLMCHQYNILILILISLSWVPTMLRYYQFISGRLKSKLMVRIEFLVLVPEV